MEAYFKIAYFAGMVVQMIIRSPYDRQRRKLKKTDQRVTTTEKLMLGVLMLEGLVLPLIYALTPWLSVADYALSPVVSAIMGGSGIAFLTASLWVFWRAHRDLGAFWSPTLEVFEQHRLVTQGIYRLIRHPMYASQLLWGIAQLLLLQNWIVGPGGLVGFFLLYRLRVPKEERMMRDHFGDQYRAYCAHTGRVLPRLRREDR